MASPYQGFAMRITSSLAVLTLALSACGPMPQRQAEAPAAAPAPAASKVATLDPNQVICRRYEETGSRVRQTKICKTRQEWDDDARLAQESLSAMDRGTQRGGGN